MTIGIYCLSFGDSDAVYIGQSINIERRYKRHINRLSKETLNSCRNTKLLKAFLKYGQPEISILETSSTDNLDNLEIYWIKEFNSIKGGLNICAGGKSGWGVDNGSSVYTVEQVLKVFHMLADDSCYTYPDIFKHTLLPISFISSIATGATHSWLEDDYLDLYNRMEGLNDNRRTKSNVQGHTKITSESRGITYPIIIDLEGAEYNVISARGFSKEHGVDPGNLIKMLDGTYKTCGKFSLKNSGDKTVRVSKVFGSIQSPEGVIFNNITNIKIFSEERSLCPSGIGKVLRGTRTSYKGWKLA